MIKIDVLNRVEVKGQLVAVFYDDLGVEFYKGGKRQYKSFHRFCGTVCKDRFNTARNYSVQGSSLYFLNTDREIIEIITSPKFCESNLSPGFKITDFYIEKDKTINVIYLTQMGEIGTLPFQPACDLRSSISYSVPYWCTIEGISSSLLMVSGWLKSKCSNIYFLVLKELSSDNNLTFECTSVLEVKAKEGSGRQY